MEADQVVLSPPLSSLIYIFYHRELQKNQFIFYSCILVHRDIANECLLLKVIAFNPSQLILNFLSFYLSFF